jgi:hypothetical protein
VPDLAAWSVRHGGGGGHLTVTGTADVGETLTAHNATATAAYSWYRDSTLIAGETDPTYVVQGADQGHLLSCQINDTSNAVAISPAPLPSEMFTSWAPGRVFTWPDDPPAFALTNYVETTDGGEPALVLDPARPSMFDPGTILTVASDLAAVRIIPTFRHQPVSPFSNTDPILTLLARYQDDNNRYWIERLFQAGSSHLQGFEHVGGSQLQTGALGGVENLDNANTTDLQTITADCFWDVLRAKTWFVTDDEPADFLGPVHRFRPAFGFGGVVDTDNDNIAETGQAGLRALYGGTIHRLQIIELVPSE